MELSKRMTMVAHMLTEGVRMADIGTDHAYVPIYLMEQGLVQSAIAMDVGKGPLKKAEENVRSHGLSEQIPCRLSDGFAKLGVEEVDAVLLAGMGGGLVVRLLTEAKEASKLPKELVLQPQSEIYKVRHYLHDLEYQITDEEMLCEDGKYYTAIKAVPGRERYEEEYEYRYGRCLILKRHPVLLTWLHKEQDTYNNIKRELLNNPAIRAKERMKELEQELVYLEGAINAYDLQ